MADSSDTESESGASAVGWDAADFVQISVELGGIGQTSVGLLELRDALDTLRGMDICAVEQDERLHERIQHISSTILSFLDRATESGQLPQESVEDVPAALLVLLDEPALTLLLQYRVLFRSIASRSLDESTSAIATATCLYHLDEIASDVSAGHSVEWWDDHLVDALDSNPYAALSMISRLLQCAVSMARDPTSGGLGPAVLDVVLKACWSIKHVLNVTWVDDGLLPSLYSVMSSLFFSLGDGDLELSIKDLILEGLSFSLSSLHPAMDAMDDQRSDCALAWERSDAFKTESSRNTLSESVLRSYRQSLQLLTVLWSTGRTPRTLSDPTLLLVSTVLGWLESEALESHAWKMLGDAAITALALWRQCGEGSAHSVGADFVWDVVQEMDPGDLALAASVAAYISATAHIHTRDTLACSEAWDYCRDVALMILNHDFVGAEEPLALLVFPVICRALGALTQNAPLVARRYYVASPWTICMIAQLKTIWNESSHGDEYIRMLRELGDADLEHLCSFVFSSRIFTQLEVASTTGSDKYPGNATKALATVQLTFCWNQSRALLIPG
ncbi:hypothetical protein BV20DRAFT_1033153 [Pilatotrama ljubarskyi]|nr:hypothetical protein BV20DRAFT_1033153 [Pilatotrama ljubarskyi]